MRAKFLIIAILLAALPLATASADRKEGHKQRAEKHDKAHGQGKYKHRNEGRPAYKAKSKRGGHGRYACAYKGNGPPPWAPAHGWRRKHGQGKCGERTVSQGDTVYTPPFDIGAGSCNRGALGAVLGGVAGAVAGSQIGKGSGQLAATAAGTLIGFLIGGSIGRGMDEIDRNCVGQALEHGADSQPVIWRNDDGRRYEVKPKATYRDKEDRYCREYQTAVIIGDRTQHAYGTACRQPDGSWKKVS